MGRCFSNGLLRPEPSLRCLVALFPRVAGMQMKRNVSSLLMTPSHLWEKKSGEVVPEWIINEEVAAFSCSSQWPEQHRKGNVLPGMMLPAATSSGSNRLLLDYLIRHTGSYDASTSPSLFICEHVTRCSDSFREHPSWCISKNMPENNATRRSNTPCWEWNWN